MISKRLELSKAMAQEYPEQPLVLAVTGTNGKTSVVDYVRQILVHQGIKAASLGSLGCIGVNTHVRFPEPTLPGPRALHPLLSDIAPSITHLAMEATSHGLHQYRMHAVKVDVAGFTNLTQDHLDYHKTMEDYFLAKSMLFEDILPQNKWAVLNEASSYFDRLCQVHPKRISYGRPSSTIYADNILFHPEGTSYDLVIDGVRIPREDPLYGDFQLENILCAAGMVFALGISMAALPVLLPPKGRLEKVCTLACGALAFVDYAHTPDALLKILKALRPLTQRNLWVVLGCGGDRDVTKRPVMGKIAVQHADHVIVTDDNPRFEDPARIRAEILSACPNALEISDRKKAILHALDSLKSGDILVVAGKGHEVGQIIQGEIFPFSDQEVILNA